MTTLHPWNGQHAAWMYDRRQQAEHTIDDILATCRDYGLTAIHQEIYYGLTPQGRIDDGLTPITIEQMVAEARAAAAAGVAYVPVVVPRGLAGEAEAHAALANGLRDAGLTPALVVDMEWDSSGAYWSVDPGLIAVYARALRAAAGPDALIGWQPDSRLADPGREREWALVCEAARPYVDAWLPQVYAGWGVYGTGQRAVDADVRRVDRFRATGRPVAPTLYTAESLTEPDRLARAVADRACGLVMFRFGATGPAGLRMFAGLPITPVPAPIPTPPPPPAPKPDPIPAPDRTRDLIDALELTRRGLSDRITALKTLSDNAEALANRIADERASIQAISDGVGAVIDRYRS